MKPTVPISQAIEESSGREVVQGSVYITLDRLERKGLVTSRLGEPPLSAAGARKRIFESPRRACAKRGWQGAH
jgi:DNA-binding PadR family transcriptional regulator